MPSLRRACFWQELAVWPPRPPNYWEGCFVGQPWPKNVWPTGGKPLHARKLGERVSRFPLEWVFWQLPWESHRLKMRANCQVLGTLAVSASYHLLAGIAKEKLTESGFGEGSGFGDSRIRDITGGGFWSRSFQVSFTAVRTRKIRGPPK